MTYLVLSGLILQCFHAIYLLQGVSKPWCITTDFGATTIYTTPTWAWLFRLPTASASTEGAQPMTTTPRTHGAQASPFLSADVNTLN